MSTAKRLFALFLLSRRTGGSFALFLAAFLLPFILLSEDPLARLPFPSLTPSSSPVAQPPSGAGMDAGPAPVAGGFPGVGPADLERADWSWERAKRLAAGIWEVQIPGDGLYESYYCGCEILRQGATGGRVMQHRCGYRIRKNAERAGRLEWEHVVPAAAIGRGRICWTEGHPVCRDPDGISFKGRACCLIADPVFAMAASDPVNLVPAIGEINGDRSDYPHAEIPGERRAYGACDMEIDTASRRAEPPAARRGDIARTWLYMSSAYGVALSPELVRLYEAWHRADPPDNGEITINRAIQSAGHRANPYVLGTVSGASSLIHP